MAEKFDPKTFAYFEAARKNKNRREWFERNRKWYEESVREPLAALTDLIDLEFAKDLPRIPILPRKISRPLLRNVTEDSGVVRSCATAFFSEKATSQFESNPGIYLSLGADADENILGLGLYIVSSRQMKALRPALVRDYAQIHKILQAKKLRDRWGGLGGDVYVRFPKGYEENSPAAKYLRHKQFFLSRHPKKKEIMSRSFFDNVLKDIESAIPFMQWVRNAVGTYQPRG